MSEQTREEILPELDRAGRIIGTVSRKEAHSNKEKIHGGVRALVIDPNKGEIYLPQRSFKKDRYSDYLDHGGGGHVSLEKQTGKLEGWKQTMVREIREEIGLTPDQYKLIRIPGHLLDEEGDPAQTEMATFYVVEVSKETELSPNPEEINTEGSGWFKITSLLEVVDGKTSLNNPLAGKKIHPMLLTDLKRPKIREILKRYLR
ncbi:MAG: NUDIX domain-containing protein [Patescibacteria group bacterium]